jgi:hypothetical protein
MVRPPAGRKTNVPNVAAAHYENETLTTAIITDLNANIVGAFKVHADDVDPEWKVPVGTIRNRPLDLAAVSKLVTIIGSSTDKRTEPAHHAAGTLPPSMVDELLKVHPEWADGKIKELNANGIYPYMDHDFFDKHSSGVRIQLEAGQHRYAAIKQFKPEPTGTSEQWWVVDLYRQCLAEPSYAYLRQNDETHVSATKDGERLWQLHVAKQQLHELQARGDLDGTIAADIDKYVSRPCAGKDC